MEYLEDQIDNISLNYGDGYKDNSDSNSETETGISLTVEYISNECLDFIQSVLRALSFLNDFYRELSKEDLDKETSHKFSQVFRDIEPLENLYRSIVDKIFDAKVLGTFYLPCIFLDDDVKGSLDIYKSFLSQYSNCAKWISDVCKEKVIYTEICETVRKRKEIHEIITLDSCLYTIFNSLFSFSMFLHRYNKCFDETNELRKKGEEVEGIIADLLNDININQKQIFLAQKELSLLNGRSKDLKLNSKFIHKGIIFCLNKKDEKIFRTLVLFSDCIYVASLPGNITGTCKVKEELSMSNLIITRTIDDDSKGNKFKWGLNINAQEGTFDFYFEDEDSMRSWKNRLNDAVKKFLESEIPQTNFETVIGESPPRWQKDSAAGYCNGYNCSQKFTPVIRRHHCRADGLLYCDSCSSYKLKLKFLKSSDSKVCELCYRILRKDLHDPVALNEAKRKLKVVFDLKTRKGTKSGWLEERIYNSEKGMFNAPVKYFCELDLIHPYLNLYEKYEDKRSHHGIMLMGMNIKTKCHSRYYGKLKPHQFIIEHQDKDEAYLFKVNSAEYCEKWVEYLTESLKSYFNTI